jgi:hypothetical protein
MEVPVLTDEQILIGKAVDANPTFAKITDINKVFKGNCPLWTYILAEAIQYKKLVTDVPVSENAAKPGTVTITTPQMGPVGGRIVAEVFLGLMFADTLSLVNSKSPWTPKGGANYGLKDFVRFALGN